MKRPDQHLLIAALLVFGAACAPTPDVPEDTPWHQLDLVALKPSAGGARADQVETRNGRLMRALVIAAGHDASWALQLGAQPALTFRPVPHGAPCTFAVAVRDGGSETELLRGAYEPAADHFHETVHVDLGAFAGRAVELTLRVLAGDGCERASWATPLVLSRRAVPSREPAERPSILIVGIDTLRADALGAYGREPSPSPVLDRLAAESDLWLEAFSSSNITNPSFVSLMTGLYPKNHGIHDLSTPLPDSATTLAEILRARGYATGAVISVDHLVKRSGLRQGFDHVTGTDTQLFAETAVTAAIDYLQEAAAPFFLWLHLFDPHVPHTPPAPYHLGYRSAVAAGLGPVDSWVPFREPGPRQFRSWREGGKKKVMPAHRDLYPGEVAYLDHQIGRLLDFLKSRGLYDETVLVVVADHGENLGEHGLHFSHGWLYDTTTHVPLMIRWPGATAGRRLSGLVQHLDVFPTLLAFAGVDVPPQDGSDLLAMADDGRARRAVFGQNAAGNGWMVRTEKHKLLVLHRQQGEERYLFNLLHDPGEERNLAGKNRRAEARLLDALARWKEERRELEAPVPAELSEADKKKLEALGYVR